MKLINYISKNNKNSNNKKKMYTVNCNQKNESQKKLRKIMKNNLN